MTTIVLLRHAATASTGRRYGGGDDPPLSDAGRHSAEVLAIRLADTLSAGIRIVASPSRRAHETATILASRMAPAVLETDARWMEASFGVADGLTFDEIDASDPELAARLAGGDVDIDWPGGETAATLHDRVAAAWEAVIAAGRPTIVVTHAGPMRIAVALATGRALGDVPLPVPAEAVMLDVEVAGRPGRGARAGP